MELESKNLRPIELTRFDRDPCKWPDFIQNFKNHVHEKQSFTDDIRMERLSVLDADAKRAVAAAGHSGLFYASALKLLKQDFRNPMVVSYKKVSKSSSGPTPNPSKQNFVMALSSSFKIDCHMVKIYGIQLCNSIC